MRYKEGVLEGLCTKAEARVIALPDAAARAGGGGERLSAVVTASSERGTWAEATTGGYVDFEDPTDGTLLCENPEFTLLGATAAMHQNGRLSRHSSSAGAESAAGRLSRHSSVWMDPAKRPSIADEIKEEGGGGGFAANPPEGGEVGDPDDAARDTDDPELAVRWTGVGDYRWDGFHLIVDPKTTKRAAAGAAAADGGNGLLEQPLIQGNAAGTVTPASGVGWKCVAPASGSSVDCPPSAYNAALPKLRSRKTKQNRSRTNAPRP